MKNRILLVEDDPDIREVIGDFFSKKSNNEIEIDMAVDGDEGMERIYEKEYDLVMLDVMLPGIDGFQICKVLRKKSIVPIIFITARGREEDVLFGYNMGCDDYIVKPFSLAELYVKTLALLRRAKGMVQREEIVCGNITINPAKFEVIVNGKIVDLPPKQYGMLKYMMENKNIVIDRETMLLRIWGYEYDGSDRVVDNHIKKLRKALGSGGKQIKTVIQKGYKIVE